jgi:hypothetical protein
METDLASGPVGRRQERLQLSVDVAQDDVVDQKFSAATVNVT